MISPGFKSMNNDPYTWKDYSDTAVEVYANTDGTWSAKVSCISNPSLSTPLQNFPDEESASHWSRQNSERIMRTTINELRMIIKSIILLEEDL